MAKVYYYPLVCNAYYRIFTSYADMIKEANCRLYPKWGKFETLNEATMFLLANQKKRSSGGYDQYGRLSNAYIEVDISYSEHAKCAVITYDTSNCFGMTLNKLSPNGKASYYKKIVMSRKHFRTIQGYFECIADIFKTIDDIFDINLLVTCDTARLGLMSGVIRDPEVQKLRKYILERKGGFAVTNVHFS